MRNYDIDAMIADATHLQNLLEATENILREMDYGTGADRNRELDYVASMVRIASDLAGKVANLDYEAVAGLSAEPSVPLRRVIEINEWVASCGANRRLRSQASRNRSLNLSDHSDHRRHFVSRSRHQFSRLSSAALRPGFFRFTATINMDAPSRRARWL